jgi:hypothetical protein
LSGRRLKSAILLPTRLDFLITSQLLEVRSNKIRAWDDSHGFFMASPSIAREDPGILVEVVTRSSTRLIQMLRSTLSRIQRSEELASDDPALAELKESVLSKIVELEVAKTPKAADYPKKILWISPKPGSEAPADAAPAADGEHTDEHGEHKDEREFARSELSPSGPEPHGRRKRLRKTG